MLDVSKEEQMDVQHSLRRSPERKPFLKFGVSAILGLEQDDDESNDGPCIRTPVDNKLKSAGMLPFDKDVFSDIVSAGAAAGAAGAAAGSLSSVKNGHPYLHSYFHPLIHATANKQIYASKSIIIHFIVGIFNLH